MAFGKEVRNFEALQVFTQFYSPGLNGKTGGAC